MSQPNDSRHFTGKNSPFRSQKRKKKVKSKRVHRNKYERRDGVMSRKKKKKKASKMVRTSKKPISLTCLINKKPICQMDIFR